jgi:hypothetical protein
VLACSVGCIDTIDRGLRGTADLRRGTCAEVPDYFPPVGQHGSNPLPEPLGALLLHQASTMCTGPLDWTDWPGLFRPRDSLPSHRSGGPLQQPLE